MGFLNLSSTVYLVARFLLWLGIGFAEGRCSIGVWLLLGWIIRKVFGGYIKIFGIYFIVSGELVSIFKERVVCVSVGLERYIWR